MVAYQVVTSALRAEVTKWQKLADAAVPVQHAVKGAILTPSAFFVGLPTIVGILDLDGMLHSKVYEGYRQFMESILGQAETEFEKIGQALNKNADEYENAESVNIDVNLKPIYGELSGG